MGLDVEHGTVQLDGDLVAQVNAAGPLAAGAVASNGSAPVKRVGTFHPTDLGNAERLVAAHGDDLRFVPGIGWFSWDGRRWLRDVDGEAMRRMKKTVRAIYTEASELEDSQARKELVRWAQASESEAKLRAAVALAETEQRVVVDPALLDADAWLFNAYNGTIDLRSGELCEHRRDDLLTKLTPAVYIASARHPQWDTFIETVTDGDEELAAFLQRAVGYSLTGLTSEEVLFFAHGPTATGKSSFLEATRATLGEYALQADFETFLRRRGDAGIRNDIARMRGSRLVVSIEVDEGKALAEGLLKVLTGGDTVTARFLYHELFEFAPTFALWLAANARPRVNADDDAIWRRIIQLPFCRVIPEADRDGNVKHQLKTDPAIHSAILAWAVQGCLHWQQQGLNVPDKVKAYTAAYRAGNDMLGDWLADACTFDPNANTEAKELRASYEAWAESNGEKPVSSQTFGAALKARDCTRAKRSGVRVWTGIRLERFDETRADA